MRRPDKRLELALTIEASQGVSVVGLLCAICFADCILLVIFNGQYLPPAG